MFRGQRAAAGRRRCMHNPRRLRRLNPNPNPPVRTGAGGPGVIGSKSDSGGDPKDMQKDETARRSRL